MSSVCANPESKMYQSGMNESGAVDAMVNQSTVRCAWPRFDAKTR